MLIKKEKALEGEVINLIPDLQVFIQNTWQKCDSAAKSMVKKEPQPTEPLNDFFRNGLIFKKMTIEQLHTEGCILFECISGSRAYGTDLPTSDTDIKGVFILPKNRFFGLNYIEQINDDGNNVMFYELKRLWNCCRKTTRIFSKCLTLRPIVLFINIRCLIC